MIYTAPRTAARTGGRIGSLLGFLRRSGHTPAGFSLKSPDARRQALARALDPDGGRARMRMAWRLLVVAAGVLVLRLAYVQVWMHSVYSRKARNQFTSQYRLPVTRGMILDRQGRQLVVSQTCANIYLQPKYLFRKKDKAWTNLRKVCSVLGLPAAQVWRQAQRSRMVWLKRRATMAEVERIRDLCQREKIAGIGYDPLCLRHYPEGRMAPQVLGTSNDAGDGLEGLEFKYNGYLRHDPEDLPLVRDNLGRVLFGSGGPVDEAHSGASLTLTIDANLQRVSERELEAGMRRFGALWGSAIVMEVKTGEILALANAPRYHPGRITGVPPEWRANRAVSTVFEPGSTFKLVTLAAALSEGEVKEDTVIDCEHGAYLLGEEVIHDTEPHGKIPVAEVFAVSSNIGFAKIGQKVGHGQMAEWAERFGFGELTKVGLSGEERGRFTIPSDLFSLSAMSFGQGIAVTPIQLAAAYGAIANGGILMRPYAVREVRDASGSVRVSNRPKTVRRVVSGRVARSLATMLQGVVDHGTGRAAAIRGYQVAGKTGTAQISDRTGYKNEKIVTFVGFLPAEAPRIVVLVAMGHPKYGTGGGVAGPVFREIALATIRQEGIPASAVGPVALGRQAGGAR